MTVDQSDLFADVGQHVAGCRVRSTGMSGWTVAFFVCAPFLVAFLAACNARKW